MALSVVRISGHGMEVTDAIRSYIEEKLNKYERLFETATSIDVECVQQIAARGVDQDFRVEISMNLPNAVARVEKSGADVYAIVDEVVDVLVRKVKRYKDKLRKWEGKETWVDLKMEREMAKSVTSSETSAAYQYSPKISEHKQIEENAPMSVEEAIERMELLDQEFYLFKRKKTKQYAVVYRVKHGEYGLMEPQE